MPLISAPRIKEPGAQIDSAAPRGKSSQSFEDVLLVPIAPAEDTLMCHKLCYRVIQPGHPFTVTQEIPLRRSGGLRRKGKRHGSQREHVQAQVHARRLEVAVTEQVSNGLHAHPALKKPHRKTVS
jgi:hypothetical protein